MSEMTEDRLVQQTVANYFHDVLKWDSVLAYNEEILGPDGTLGRTSEKEVVLVRYLRMALEKFNPDLPAAAYESAIKQITETSVSKSLLQINREKYGLCKKGVEVSFRNAEGHIEKKRLIVFDFEKPEENHFLVVRELWVQGNLYRRRPDIIGFVNGIPLLFFELKNVHKDIRRAYNENLSDYKDTIPHVFDHNELVILSNGDKAKLGSISSKYGHFHEWKRLAEEEPGVVDMETLLKGVCSKRNFMDIFENFTVFDDSSGKLVKIVARNHQFLGVNRAVEAVRNPEHLNGQLGVFWHTQGSGKSYSMLFFTEKVKRKLSGNFTFLIVTDREDLDDQIYKTFAGCGIVDNDSDRCRAGSGNDLRDMLKRDKSYVFTMVQKFNQTVSPDDPYSLRNDIIVLSDEAHRTHYGILALNMRNSLPRAHYMGFTGTPLFKSDELTKKIFGDYVSTYDFQRAVDDKATVPLYYDNRGEKLHITTTEINAKIADKLEQMEAELDPDKRARLEQELAREYHIITAGKRLDAIARDFVDHYAARWETGKVMLVCIDKITTVRMFNLIQFYWAEAIKEVEAALAAAADEQEEVYLRRKVAWMKETEKAVVVSEEQGEVKRFETWDLDIIPHREKMKKGFETPDGKRIDLETAFKNPEHPFRIAIVCAMWMTGFDVPSMATLYLDKPLKAHTLMQAIARANRVYEGKNNGLIVDYCGILKNLRQALATFAGTGGSSGGGQPPEPVKPEEELIAELAAVIKETRRFMTDRGYDLDSLIGKTGFEKIAAINAAKEVVNQTEETRKRFEIQAREVFKKFKACITIKSINDYRKDHDAIDIIYKKLQDDKDKADITDIIKELHAIIDESIAPTAAEKPDADGKLYDISKIDFERLRQEFAKSPRKNTTVYALKEMIERRLLQLMKQNPLRTDFNKRYQEIIAGYNLEKDRVTIEKTFAALLSFVGALDEEQERAIREGLDEEKLALFDLLMKPELMSAQHKMDREKIKKVATDLLTTLKAEKLKVDNWREKEATKAEVKTFIHDFLWNDKSGLPPDFYSPDEVEQKTAIIYDHVFKQYADADHHPYSQAA